jgi:hypothetical protein
MVTHDSTAASIGDDVLLLAAGRIDLRAAPSAERVLECMKQIGHRPC